MATKEKTEPLAKPVAERFGYDLFAMSNLRSTTTGVEGTVIWVSAGEFGGVDSQHGPRMKVALGDKLTPDGLKHAVTVKLSNPPQVLGTLPVRIKRAVIRFVDANRDVLLRHWNGEIATREMLDGLRRI